MDERLAHAERIAGVLERLAGVFEAIPQQHADTRVVEAGSTPAMIGAHVIGSVRASVLGIACGRQVSRDREQEFAAAGVDLEEIAGGLRSLAAETREALSTLDPAVLDERITPAQSLMGAAPARELARREAMVNALAHAAEHLGELQLIRDVVSERDRSGAGA